MEKEYLETIIRPLLSEPDELRVEQTLDERGMLLSVNVRKADMGRVLGKDGETARAIRRLVRQHGFNQNAHVAVKFNEPTQ
jgi:predicted RNA-binding protein YlqC (UPF0109 family)